MGHDRRGDPVGDIVMIRPARARKIVARHDAVWVPQSLLAEHRSTSVGVGAVHHCRPLAARLHRHRCGAGAAMKIDITCPQCGTVSAKEVRKVNEARKAGLPIYCSAACSHAAKRTPKITIMCQQCGKEMLLPPSIAVKTYYCSIACRSAWDRSRYINRFWQNVEKTKDVGNGAPPVTTRGMEMPAIKEATLGRIDYRGSFISEISRQT